MTAQTERVAEFHRLHGSGTFVMPNPWDVGSARVLEQLGFPALATTSSGFAWTTGCRDNEVGLERTLAHLRVMAAAVSVPLNADFEAGFAVEPQRVRANVALAAATGVAGLSVEDSTGDPAAPLYDFALAVERVHAAREAIDEAGTGVVLTGRSEGFIAGRPDLEQTVRRLVAYRDAGADCLYAPGIRTAEQVSTVVAAVAPKPVNLLLGAPFMTVAEAAALGVRRISTGGALARTAWAGFLQAAEELAGRGTLAHFVDLPDMNARLGPA